MLGIVDQFIVLKFVCVNALHQYTQDLTLENFSSTAISNGKNLIKHQNQGILGRLFETMRPS